MPIFFLDDSDAFTSERCYDRQGASLTSDPRSLRHRYLNIHIITRIPFDDLSARGRPMVQSALDETTSSYYCTALLFKEAGHRPIHFLTQQLKQTVCRSLEMFLSSPTSTVTWTYCWAVPLRSLWRTEISALEGVKSVILRSTMQPIFGCNEAPTPTACTQYVEGNARSQYMPRSRWKRNRQDVLCVVTRKSADFLRT